MNIDDKEVMSALTKMVIDTFTREIAAKAREFSCNVPEGVTAQQALLAFADSIEATNDKMFPSLSPCHN
jgi:hypothetical protein